MNVNRAPRISVLISSYNNARFVDKKLAEISAQTFFDQAEFHFIETASPERERELFQPFCREHSHCRVIATDARRNLYEAWNLGWAEARAPIVCYSNMDDAMHPRLLESVGREMEARSLDVCTALIAKQRDYAIVMWRLTMPSFNLYSERLVEKREPRAGDIVITKSIYLATLKHTEIIYQKNGIVLDRIGAEVSTP